MKREQGGMGENMEDNGINAGIGGFDHPVGV